MTSFKVVVSDPKTGKATNYDLKDQLAKPLIGLRLGDTFNATVLNIQGTLKITGGSDKAGFPMRKDVLGGVKKYVLLTKGVGLQKVSKGEKKRKLIRGNTITDKIYQINTILIEELKEKEVTPVEEVAEKEVTPVEEVAEKEVN